jgi:hypothetical protein
MRSADGRSSEIPSNRRIASSGRHRCVLALGRPKSALQPLGEARELFAGLGAVPAVEEADTLLQRAAAGG